MTDETRFTVLVSIDGGVNWRRHAGIIATSVGQASKRVQKEIYPSEPDALFYATQRFTPREMVEHMTPKLRMEKVELDAEPTAPAPVPPMPHEPQPGDSSVAPGEFES